MRIFKHFNEASFFSFYFDQSNYKNIIDSDYNLKNNILIDIIKYSYIIAKKENCTSLTFHCRDLEYKNIHISLIYLYKTGKNLFENIYIS